MKLRLILAAYAVFAGATAGTVDAQNITRRESFGEVRNRVTVETVLSVIDNNARVAGRLSGLRSLMPDRIRVVDVRPYIPAGKRNAYTASLRRNAKTIQRLRANLITMDGAVMALANRTPRLIVDDVIGAGILDVIETGKSANVLVLYVDTRNSIARTAWRRNAQPVATATAAPAPAPNAEATITPSDAPPAAAAPPAARAPVVATSVATSFRPTAASLFAAMQVTPEMAARVSALRGLRADRIAFFDIGTLLSAADTSSYVAAVRANDTSIRALRSELSKWPLVVDAIRQQDPQMRLGDIFAADLVEEGDVLVLYYRKRAS